MMQNLFIIWDIIHLTFLWIIKAADEVEGGEDEDDDEEEEDGGDEDDDDEGKIGTAALLGPEIADDPADAANDYEPAPDDEGV